MALLVHEIFFLQVLILPICNSYRVLESTLNTISAGEVSYYHISYPTPVVVALVSLEGDVDLYASPTNHNPKPSGLNYDFCSTSCGIDFLMLPTNHQAPKYTVGIFGHVRYERSTYKLFIISPSEEDIRHFQESCVYDFTSVFTMLWNSASEIFHRDSNVSNTAEIWDWDYEKEAEVLLIDVDHMVFLNDPVLINFIWQVGGIEGGLTQEEQRESKGERKGFLNDVAGYGATVLLKILEVAIEILAS